MNDKETSKLTAGEAFQIALTIQFVIVLLAAFALLLNAISNDTLTVGKFFIGLAVCYNSFLPVLFARCLASIERNTTPDSKQEEPKAASAPVTPVIPPVAAPVAAASSTHSNADAKATVIGDMVICPNCNKQQRKNRTVCFECGAALKTE